MHPVKQSPVGAPSRVPTPRADAWGRDQALHILAQARLGLLAIKPTEDVWVHIRDHASRVDRLLLQLVSARISEQQGWQRGGEVQGPQEAELPVGPATRENSRAS